ncbi:MAG TPA: amidase family protein, partial [Paracoccaceae bacterium]|nr:amidase family protein [Paracoccaceae bacterium]
RFRGGASITAKDYLNAREAMYKLRRDFAAATAGYDGILLPTIPIVPPTVQALLDDAAYFTRTNLLALRNTRVINLMGGCAITLPLKQPGCGLMVAAGAGQDRRLLRVAAGIEAALAR